VLVDAVDQRPVEVEEERGYGCVRVVHARHSGTTGYAARCPAPARKPKSQPGIPVRTLAYGTETGVGPGLPRV
ncbi:MAG TPA: hypothetical protein VGD91_22685, partial [Trebonia sp.]